MTNLRKIKHCTETDSHNNFLVCFSAKRVIRKIDTGAGRYDTISVYKYDKSEHYYILSLNRSLDYMGLSVYNSKTDSIENDIFLDNGSFDDIFKKDPFSYSDQYIIKILSEYCY